MNALKICGINSAEFAGAAVSAGVDYLGFIFCPESPRHVSPEQAERIFSRIDRTHGKIVGVFVDISGEKIRKIAERLHLDVIQLHGTEPAELAASLRGDYEVWKAVSAGFDPAYPADAFLVDSGSPGSGMRSDRTLAVRVLEAGKRLVLAGGLSAANLAEAARIGADVLDVNSSLEDAPGHKSIVKLNELISIYQGVQK